MHYTETLSVIGSVLNLTGLSVERWNRHILNMTTDVRYLTSRTFDFRNIGRNIKFCLSFLFPMPLKSSFGWLHVIGYFPFQYLNWEVGIFKRIWYYIYGIRPIDDHQRKISTEISDPTKLELFIQRIVKEECAKFIWNGDDNISADMTHSQMLGKIEYTLPAKFWRLVGCTEMLSW